MVTIRTAAVGDAVLIRKMVSELADFEREANQVWTIEAGISRDGFQASPQFRALIAEWSGQGAGFALYFGYCST